MNEPSTTALRESPAVAGRPVLECLRIRFLANAAAGAKVRRKFQQPAVCIAMEETVAPDRQPKPPTWPEPTDHLEVIFARPGADNAHFDAETWLSAPSHPEAAPAIVIQRDGATISWRPGRALVEARPEQHAEILAALVEFAFYEGHLRSLERTLEMKSADADADVAMAYRIRYRDRAHWPRFRELIECFSGMRLTYARLSPRLVKPSRTLAPAARRLFAGLLRRADIEDRLEAFGDRLESCEDLYEGASDRVADYRWYLHGHWIELTIVVLLFLEVVLLVIDIWLHLSGE